MKIQGPGQTQGTSSVKGKGKKSGGGGFGAMVSSGGAETGATQATQNIAQLDALLAIQGAEDPMAGAAKKRAYVRSEDLLDGLDKIRMAMLTGDLTVGHMIDVADVVASHRDKIADPALTSVMDEIDLRAQVELAKMRVALEFEQKKKQESA